MLAEEENGNVAVTAASFEDTLLLEPHGGIFAVWSDKN